MSSRLIAHTQQQLRMSDRAAVVVFGLCWLVVSAVVCAQAEVVSGTESTLSDEECLYESTSTCLRTVGCVWCDLPRRCYSAARSLELGEFCTRKRPKVFVDVATCDEISDSESCSREDSCRWCRSDKVDDGCFEEIDAWRLPKHIYTCALVSLASSSTTVLGIGL